jgi:predicted Zn-dependent protease
MSGQTGFFLSRDWVNLQTMFKAVHFSLRAPMLMLVAVFFLQAPIIRAKAQETSRVSIIRDAEIERLMRDYARPIIRASGLGKGAIDIVLVNDPTFNAFVTGRRMFIHTGAILRAETPGELIGVIAHETGHMAGGHQFRMRQRADTAEKLAVLSTILGVGVTVAGAATKNNGLAGVGGGLAAGGVEAATRSLLSYQRGEEMNADRSAIEYLNKTQQSAAGLLRTLKRFADALSLSGTRVDPYRISHPLPQERLSNLETLAHESPYFDKKDPPELQLRHDMARAKIAAYTIGGNVIARLFRNDPKGAGARYGMALTAFLYGSPKAALAKTDALIKEMPGNPYLYELRGDTLIKLNKAADAAAAYQKAMNLDPEKSPLLQTGFGQALLLAGKTDAAKKQLNAALARDKDNIAAYEYLARAYGQTGDEANAELATADMHYYGGDMQQARIFAARAQRQLKTGSPGWLRAQDIINNKPTKKK